MTRVKPILPVAAFGNTFYHHFILHGSVVIDQWEHYEKQTWRNRYDILGPNGVLSLAIPVVGQKGIKTPVTKIHIDNKSNWPTLHLRTLEAAYGSAPFYDHYASSLKELLHSRFEKLIDFNSATMEWAAMQLGNSPNIEYTSQYFVAKEGQIDARRWFKPGPFKKLSFSPPPYIQVFSDRFGFIPNLSVIDLLMNLGPDATGYLLATRFDASQIAIFGRQ